MEKVTLKDLFKIDRGDTRYVIFRGVAKDIYRVNKEFHGLFRTYFQREYPELLEREIYSLSLASDPYGTCVLLIIEGDKNE